MEFVTFIIDNWFVIVATVSVFSFLVATIIKYFNMPTSKQISNLMEWLKIAVVEAEKSLGSGTGQLKLRAVYEAAIVKFPWIATYISFDKFSTWVDIALDWMKEQIESNKKIETYIES